MTRLAWSAVAHLFALAVWTVPAFSQGTAGTAPACIPITPSQNGVPRIPATLEPPGAVAPIVRPFADLPPFPAPPPAMGELAPIPTIDPGRFDAIDQRIRDLRGRMTKSPPPLQPPVASPAAVQSAPPAPPAPGSIGDAAPFVPSPAAAPAAVGGMANPLGEAPPVPLGNGGPAPAPQQSISPHSIGLDPVRTQLSPPAPPQLLDGNFSPAPRVVRPGAIPPTPSATEINSTSVSALTIPVEILRSPIDHIALADNLYAARSYGLALEAYQSATKANGTPAARRWANYQVANCYRQLGQTAEAERQFRRVAGDRHGGQFSDLARWWLQAMDQRSLLTSQLQQMKGAIESTQETTDAGSAQ